MTFDELLDMDCQVFNDLYQRGLENIAHQSGKPFVKPIKKRQQDMISKAKKLFNKDR
jgi:hypothetical protein